MAIWRRSKVDAAGTSPDPAMDASRLSAGPCRVTSPEPAICTRMVVARPPLIRTSPEPATEMFSGPLDQSRPWDAKAIVGPYRLLQRLWWW